MQNEDYSAIFPSPRRGATPTSDGREIARADLQPLMTGRPRGQSADPWLDPPAWWCTILSMFVPLLPTPRVYR